MDEIRRVTIVGKEYEVKLNRFDDVIDPDGGTEYHGFHVTIVGDSLWVSARKYDDETFMHILSGVREDDLESIAVVRRIAKELFDTNQLQLLTQGDPPFKEI